MTINEQTANAKRAALRLLGMKDYTKQELKRKLIARGFEMETVQETLSWLEANRWQSDQRVAERLTERLTLEKPSGRRRILKEFFRRGLSPPTEQFSDREEELERASQALRSQYGETPPEDMDVRQANRCFQFLIRRGFEYETARDALHRWMPRLLDLYSRDGE